MFNRPMCRVLVCYCEPFGGASYYLSLCSFSCFMLMLYTQIGSIVIEEDGYFNCPLESCAFDTSNHVSRHLENIDHSKETHCPCSYCRYNMQSTEPDPSASFLGRRPERDWSQDGTPVYKRWSISFGHLSLCFTART